MTKIISGLLLCFAVMQASAEQNWYPVAVNSAVDAYNLVGPARVTNYVPLPQAQEKWNICVSFPHLKDDYWLAVNYGIVDEAKRLGVALDLYEAGGYTELDEQIRQIENCVAQGADAVIIGAIHANGLNSLVEKLHAQNIPVIDLVNGMSTKASSARSLVSFYQMGYKAGAYIADLQVSGDQPLSVAWFPGPKDAAWVEAGNRGFLEAIKDKSIKIINTSYGDAGRSVQRDLIRKMLDENTDVDIIAGTSATVLAAVSELRKLDLKKQPQLVSYYMTRNVYNAILRGRVLAAPTDKSVLQGRIAIDQATRILEGKPFLKHAAPMIQMVDKKSLIQLNIDAMLAPNGFKARLSFQ